jgi:hypothetical protein
MRIALQAVLGSDLSRELNSIKRMLANDPDPILLFEVPVAHGTIDVTLEYTAGAGDNGGRGVAAASTPPSATIRLAEQRATDRQRTMDLNAVYQTMSEVSGNSPEQVCARANLRVAAGRIISDGDILQTAVTNEGHNVREVIAAGLGKLDDVRLRGPKES